MRKVHIGVWLAMLNLLSSSWKDISYDYEKLTVEEKKLITKDEFDYLVREIKTNEKEKENGVVYN